MSEPFQFSLLTPPARPQASPRAPAGVQRAAHAGGRVDEAILAWCRAHVGQEASEVDLWQAVNAIRPCVPDTTRRRRDALEAQGFIRTEDAGPGRFRVVEVGP